MDIKWNNTTMPVYADGMSLWDRVRCLLGYHRWEPRCTDSDHKYPGMKLRDQCGRCCTLR